MEKDNSHHGFGLKTYLLIQSYECFNWYLTSQMSAEDNFNADKAYMTYICQKKNDAFREKMAERHPVLKAFCALQNINISNIPNTSIAKELTYILNNPSITEENITDYCNEEHQILEMFKKYSPQDKQLFYQYACPLIEEVQQGEGEIPNSYALNDDMIQTLVKSKINEYRPIFHQLKAASSTKEYPQSIPLTSIKEDSVFKKDLESMLISA